MKIQCSCGAKYAFDATPEMARTPVRLVCQGCGLDLSDFVNDLIRKEFASGAPTAGETATSPAPVETTAPPAGVGIAPPPAATPRLRINTGSTPAGEAPGADTDALPACPKHPGQVAAHRCHVCQKPICPKCMEVFGYVCSAHCRAKAAANGIDVPVYAGQKSVVEARLWRRTSRIATGICAALVLMLGLWGWYTWFGSRPKVVFAAPFSEPAFSGQSRLCGGNQIVFLHGSTLARYDLKTKKEIWSAELVDKQALQDQASKSLKAMQAAQEAAARRGDDTTPARLPSVDDMVKGMVRAAAAAMQLRIVGQSVWVVQPGKLARYDWDTGKAAQEISLSGQRGELDARDNEFLLIEPGAGRQVVTHVDLASGQKRTEEIADTAAPAVAAGGLLPAGIATPPNAVGPRVRSAEPAGIPGGAEGRRPLNPGRMSEQAQHLSLPERLALPAVLAVNRNQERALEEMRREDAPARPQPVAPVTPPVVYSAAPALIPTRDGFVEFFSQLIEQKLVTRDAMKAPPKKSALNDSVSVGNSTEVANEMLNDMQRERGGGTVVEDESRYRVTVRRPGTAGAEDWTGEVIGRPSVFPLETVTVVAGGKTIEVLDKLDRPRWRATLAFPIPDLGGSSRGEESPFGQGPCVERDGALYVFDQGVLTAFDLASGLVRWRLPSVGVAGLFFDDAGMLYVNSTTASPESIKYARQIDITQKISSIVLKIDPRTGKTLWTANPNGLVSYLSGKFIYVIRTYAGDFDENGDSRYGVDTGLEKRAYVRIDRLNPGNGRVLWEYFQQRMPLDVRFDKNTICLVFKKEVQVLKFLSL